MLPADRATLYRNAVAGPETKTLIVYDEPFWRADGFSGQTAGPETMAEVTLDATPRRGRRVSSRRSRSGGWPSDSTRWTRRRRRACSTP